jgi:membrane associated rhomboid family serine protease
MSRSVPFYRRQLPFTYFYATLGIIAVNLMFFLWNQTDPNSRGLVALNVVAVLGYGEWWQVFTYMYVHATPMHILFNMIALFFFGLALEHNIGSWEFLIFYHVIGLLAGLFSLLAYAVLGADQVWLMGASGAIFGVMLGYATFRPNDRVLVFFIIPLRAMSMVLIFTAFEVFSEFLNPYSGVAHLTHLAGFLFAFFYLWIRFRLNPWTVFWNRDRYR